MHRRVLLTFVAFAGVIVSFGQETPREWYLSRTNGGLCSESIVIYKDGTFVHEHGCEASSHISYGNWVQKKDTLKFRLINNKTYKVIKDIVTTKTDSRKLTVRVFDNLGVNITNRVSIVQYVNGKGYYMVDLDSSKLKATEFVRDSGVLILKSLQKIFQQKLEINTTGANNFDITLNIPGEWIFNSYADLGGRGDFVLLKSTDKLTSIEPGYFGVNGPEKTVYLKQQE